MNWCPVDAARASPPRWARIAAHTAALTPVPSAVWRLALALGLSAGYTEAGLDDLGVGGWDGRAYLIALSVATEVAALLTIGLVAPWGEAVPRWVPRYGRRPLRTRWVVTVAAVGAGILTVIWTPNLAWWAIDHPGMTEAGAVLVGLAYLPLVAWGPLLAAVTVSYARRAAARTVTP